ncbi:tetratricopeptide repeat protein, partial [Actinosynnema sp. NPDC059797]
LEARAALYRSLVADRRVLVVLDNAATTEQVVPLLPGGPSCAALVTSRHRLRGLTARHGTHPLPLGVLTDAESRALLTTALGPGPVADDRATAELIALCGGFPLALGLAAARGRPDLPLSEVVTELREFGLDALDADDPTAGLPAVLSWSLRHLTDRQRTAFALLGIAPGPDIDLPAAAGLTGLPEREARAELRALTDASLLDRNAGGRYAMHDVVRAYATSTAHDLPDPVRRAALERVLDFYLHTARTADRLLDPHRTPIPFEPPVPGARPHALGDPLAAQVWLDAHHPHLLATQRAAAAHHRHRTAWRTAWTLSTFHWWRSLRHDELAAWRAAADAAAHLPDPTTRILTHRFLGRAHLGLGHHDEAVAHLDRALTLAEHHCDIGQQADTHYALSWLWDLRGDDRKALEHVLRALAFYRDLGRPVQEAEALNVAGWHTARLGDHDTARHHCEAALVLHRRHGNPEGEASTLDSLGYVDHRTGRHHRATRHYREALALLRDLGNATQVAHTLDGLGHPHVALGQHDRARAAWREALELYREQGRVADAQRVRRQLDALGPEDDPPTGPAT